MVRHRHMHCRMGEHGELTFGWCAQTSSASHTTAPAARRMRRCSTPKVLPAYAARFKGKNDSEEAYVKRVRKDLEDKFLELGPDTVVGCESSRLPRLLSPHLSLLFATQSLRRPSSARPRASSLRRRATSRL